MLKARIQKHRGKPPSPFTISVLGSFTCITQYTGPTALRPIRRTKQLWLSVLLKDTSAATGQAGIRTHILATPELESNALDRSATTLQIVPNIHYLYGQLRFGSCINSICLCSELQQTNDKQNLFKRLHVAYGAMAGRFSASDLCSDG